MTVKLSAGLLAFTLAATSAIAQNSQAPQAQPPKASKAEVQALVDSIKNDQKKMAQFCTLTKLQDQYATVGKDAKKLKELDRQMGAASESLGPDFDKVSRSELDDKSAVLLDDLSKACTK